MEPDVAWLETERDGWKHISNNDHAPKPVKEHARLLAKALSELIESRALAAKEGG